MIIGLTGFAGVGKDTVGAELVRRGFKRLSFAGPLKELALECDPIVGIERNGRWESVRLASTVGEHGWDYAKFQTPDTRRFLQALGMGARRVFGEDFWVNQVRDQIEFDEIHGIVGHYVVTDVRFPNEARMIKGYGQGYMVQIARPGYGPVNTHESEHPLPANLIDTVVSNFGGLEKIPGLADWILGDVAFIKAERIETRV